MYNNLFVLPSASVPNSGTAQQGETKTRLLRTETSAPRITVIFPDKGFVLAAV
jgi:hypothetical protein